ncbi:hypothetical protein MD484_g6653, partial [Candolleomyces efflorescens]
MAFEIYWKGIPEAVVFGLVVLHHLLNTFGPRFIPLFTWLDLLLTTAELAFGIVAVARLSAYVESYRWFPKRAVSGIFNVWLLSIMLAVLLCAKVVQLVDARGVTFFRRVDILRDRVGDEPGYERLRKLSGDGTIPWWRYPVHVLFGRKIWERKLPGESSWIAFSRGLLALLVITSLAVFALLEIVALPVSEMGLTPNRVFRTQYLPLTFNSTTPIVWNLIVTWRKHPNAPKSLRQSISVHPIWSRRPEIDPPEGPFGPKCHATRATQDMLPSNINAKYFEVIVFHCPPRVDVPPDQAYSFHSLSYNRTDTRPNLFLRANFTGLMGPGHTPNAYPDMIWDAMKVYLALTNNTEDALLTTRPTPLFPGNNLVGLADLMLYDTFMIADIPSTVHDSRVDHPLFRDSPSYSVGTNISTLRIASQIDPREWTVIQDYRNKSVLGGIAAVGGLGSFLSIFFVVWFGGSLFGIIFRTKPLTPFGIVHHLENQKARLATSTNEKYHALRSDLQSLKDNPGLLSFVFDALIDLDVVAEEHPSWEKSMKARVHDPEQDLPNESRDPISNSGERLREMDMREDEDPSGVSQPLVGMGQNYIGVESGSGGSESGDEGEEGPSGLMSQDTNEDLLPEDERRLLVPPSLPYPQFSKGALRV